jgi:transcription elongation factor Elf1
MADRKEPRKRPIKKSAPAKVFGAWFRCPRCGGRSIIFQKREASYACRRCGCEFLVNWDESQCYIPGTEGGSE